MSSYLYVYKRQQGLGHEVIACACGAKVVKMKVGHHGNSSPVRNLKKNKIEFTAQNHGYEIAEDSLIGTGLIVTYKALNDNSIEGCEHETYPLLSFSDVYKRQVLPYGYAPFCVLCRKSIYS